MMMQVVMVDVSDVSVLELVLERMIFLEHVAAFCVARSLNNCHSQLLQITWSATLSWLHHGFCLISWRQLIECK